MLTLFQRKLAPEVEVSMMMRPWLPLILSRDCAGDTHTIHQQIMTGWEESKRAQEGTAGCVAVAIFYHRRRRSPFIKKKERKHGAGGRWEVGVGISKINSGNSSRIITQHRNRSKFATTRSKTAMARRRRGSVAQHNRSTLYLQLST